MTRTTFITVFLVATALLYAEDAHPQKGGGGGPLNEFAASPAPMRDFGSVPVGGVSTAHTIRLSNHTTLAVDVEIPATLGRFVIISGAGSYSIPSGEWTDVGIRFYPTMVGTEVVEFYPSGDSELVLSFIGEGTVSPDCGQGLAEMDFGSVDIGSPESLIVVVGNDSGSTRGFNFVGGCNAFQVTTPTPITVPDGQTGQITVEFDPQYEGEYVGEFLTGCGTTVWLTGTGVDPSAKAPGDLASPATTSISLAAAPNPMRHASHIRYAYIGEGTLAAKLRIVDLRGRVLRTESLAITPGSHVWEWDRRDADGRSVASGVYFLELAAPGTTARQKVTVLR